MTAERETEPAHWFLARRFAHATGARRAYEAARDLILADDLAASVFRYTLAGVSFVAAIGEPPLARDSLGKLEQLLRAGEAAEVPPQVLQHLRDRRRRVSVMRIDFFERRSGDL